MILFKPFTGWLSPFLISLTACLVVLSTAPGSYGASKPEKVALQLAWKHQFQFAGYYAALAKGYYRQAGLDVKIVEGGEGRFAREELLQRRAQYGVAGSELLLHRLGGDPFVVLAPIFQHSPSILLTRADAGISSLQDLVGKKVMLLPGKKDADILAALLNEGVSLNSIERLDQSYNLSDLVEGRTDAVSAYLTNEPYLLAQQGIAPRTISPLTYGVDFYSDCLFTTEQEIKKNPERVGKFLKASLRGWEYALANPEEIIDLILTDYGSNKGRDNLLYEAESIKKLMFPDLVQIGHMNPGRWQHIAKTYMKLGMIDGGYSLDGFLYKPLTGSDNAWLIWIIVLVLAVSFMVCIWGLFLIFVNRKLRREIDDRKLAEEKLKDSEIRFRHILEGFSEISIQGYDADRRVIYWNNASKNLFGYSESEALGKKLEDLIIPSVSRRQVQELFHRWIEFDEKVVSSERDLVGKNGEVVPVFSSHVMLETQHGKEIFCIDFNLTPIRKTEKALRESEKLLTALFDTAEDSIFIKDARLRYKKVNPAMEHLFGRSLEEIIGKTYSNIFGNDLGDYNSREDDRVLAGETVEGYPAISVEGEVRQFHMIKVPLKSGTGQITGLCGIARDITERMRAEEVIKTLFAVSNAVLTAVNLNDLYHSIHKSLGSILDATNFLIAIVNNREHTIAFPYYVDEKDDYSLPIKGFTAKDSLTGLVVLKRKPILLKRAALEERAAKKGVQGTLPLIWMGVPLIIRDEVIGVVAVQSYDDENIYNEQDLKVLSVISEQMALAIERKRAEEALRQSEKKYRHLFDNAPAGMCEIDLVKNEFISVNEVMCRYAGYSEKELLALNPVELLVTEARGEIGGRIERFLAGEKPSRNGEYNILRKDGQKLAVILISDFIYKDEGESGAIIGARVVVHDITERKLAEKEKREAQRVASEHEKMALVGQIAGKMAHDFNNILGVIMGNAELSLLECTDTKIRKTLRLIFEQTIRGKNLTKNLVAFAKDQELKQEYFRIGEKIDLVLNLLRKDLDGIEIMKEDSHGVPELLADPGMIEHALVNLILNSVHAVSMVKNPKIIIRTYRSKEYICFEIEDNGCGIPGEHLESIYEPSFTLKGSKDVTGSYKADIKGTGYGMANVKKYIEQHRGDITVVSEFDSGAKFTKFTIRLPVIKKELSLEEKVAIRQGKAYFDKYILLVEDEHAISDVQYRVLTQEPCNHRVDIANNGQIAMDLFARNSYDFVSLDYILPGTINGMDVYNHIRTEDETIPILFISGNIEFLQSIKELKQKDSYVDHLSKPCQNIDYVTTINSLLERSHK